MGHHPGAEIAYGVNLYQEGWQIKDAEDDWEYVPPWEQGLDEDERDAVEAEALFLRYLLKRLPEDACGSEIDAEETYDLNKILTAKTGLRLVSYGYEGGSTFLASGPTLTVYAYDVVDTAKGPKPTEEHKKWMTWAIETAGVEFTMKPCVALMVSYG